MGRNARRRKQIKERLDGLANHGLEIGRVAKAVAEDGYGGLEVAKVNVSPGADGYEIICGDCGASGRLPEKPDPFPDKIRCPDCMRARIARGG